MSNAIYHVDLQHFLGDFGLTLDSITEKIAEGFCTLAFFQAFYWGKSIEHFSSIVGETLKLCMSINPANICATILTNVSKSFVS